MESPPLAIDIGRRSKKHDFTGSSSSLMDPEVVIAPETSPNSISKKLKQNEVGSHEVIEIDTDEDPAGGLIINDKVDVGNKGKATFKAYDKNWQNQFKDPLASEPMVPTSAADYVSTGGAHPLKNFTPGSHNPINLDAFNSDLLYDDDDDDDDDDAGDDDDDVYDDDDDDYNDDLTYDDDYLSLQAQFDTVDLPPGVEASVPWLQDPAQSEKKLADPSSSTSSSFQTQYNAMPLPAGVEVSSPWLQVPAKSQQNPDATSSSIVPAESCSNGKEEYMEEDEVMNKFLIFKRFDTVQDYSDHHFTHGGSSTKQPSKNWAKKIQEEWKILEKDLPDTICVRVYEARMDLLRAVIVGAAGTPYHDGLFFFDVFFPSDYPSVPPQVYYYSGGLRLNPNLYECGKVCLSLLNTWSGNKNEKWIPANSTMLQVLVSIQGLILNAQPFFNEPGYERMNGEPEGERRSRKYNENTFILSLQTMLYTLRRPPKHFEDFVAGHFRKYAHDILQACKAYMEGTQIGCLDKGRVQGIDEGDKSSSKGFKAAIPKMVRLLVVAFTKNGAKGCEQFLPPAPSENSSERLDTTPTQ